MSAFASPIPWSDHEHIIWDWNGTLLDDAWLCVEITDAMLCARGLGRLTHDRYFELFDFPVQDYYRRLGFDFSSEPYEQLAAEFIEAYEARRHECALRQGARETLAGFARMGIAQSLLSAYRHETLESLVRELDLRSCFQELVGQDDFYAAGKTANGQRMIDRLGLDPARVVLIGDTTHDHAVARAMGVNCILVPGGHHPRAKLEACRVPVVDTLPEIIRNIA